MSKFLTKDNQNRQQVFSQELTYFIIKYIYRNCIIPFWLRSSALITIKTLFSFSSKLNKICVISKNSRSFSKFFQISRHQLKTKLYQQKFASNLILSTW